MCVNTEGRRLLAFCEDFGLTILNGRAAGDIEGKLTYVGPRGSSVLDYVIVKEKEKERAAHMSSIEVIATTESDHLPIT